MGQRIADLEAREKVCNEYKAFIANREARDQEKDKEIKMLNKRIKELEAIKGDSEELSKVRRDMHELIEAQD